MLFAGELAKDIHTQDDLADLSASLVKMTIEATLSAEMEHHLGYAKHEQIIKKTMYITLGVNLEGKKECLGLVLFKNEYSIICLSENKTPQRLMPLKLAAQWRTFSNR